MVQKDDVLPKRGNWHNNHYNADDDATNDDYTTVLRFVSVAEKSHLVFLNTGSNQLSFSIYGSIKAGDDIPDETDDSWYPLQEDEVLEVDEYELSPYFLGWAFILVQIKSTTPGQSTTFKVWERGQ